MSGRREPENRGPEEAAAREAVRIAHGVLPRTLEDVGEYWVVPIEDVPIGLTPLLPALDGIRERDPFGAAMAQIKWDHQLRPAVREAAKTDQDARRRLDARNRLAAERNAPVLAALDGLVAEREAEAAAYQAKRNALAAAFENDLLNVAKASASAKLETKPHGRIAAVPDASRLLPAEAHAAENGIPYNEGEAAHLGPKWLETALSAIVAIALGISMFAAAGIVHLDALGRNWGLAVVAWVIGFALTYCAGSAVKLLWRNASEAQGLGKRWVAQGSVAFAVTIVFVALDTAVDAKGLMAAAARHDLVQSVSGKVAAAKADPTAFMVAAVVSAAYFAFASVTGWRKDRSALVNRVIRSKEAERLARYEELRSDPAWVGALEASNVMNARTAAFELAVREHEAAVEALDSREKALKARLLPLPDSLSEEEALIVESAASQARGQQIELEKLVQALREGRTEASASGSPGKPARAGLLASIRKRLSDSASARGGA